MMRNKQQQQQPLSFLLLSMVFVFRFVVVVVTLTCTVIQQPVVTSLLLQQSKNVLHTRKPFISTTTTTRTFVGRKNQYETSQQYIQRFHSSNNDNNNSNEFNDLLRKSETKEGNVPTNFNPFEYNASVLSSNTNSISSSTLSNERKNIISLRQIRMQEITNQLLATGGNRIEIQSILQMNRDFLVEPIENMDIVLDDNMKLIYENCVTRHERYRAYEQTILQRIQNATNKEVIVILNAMKEFILACE